MMETVGIPYNNFSLCNLRDEFGGRVAVSTHTKILHYLYNGAWGCVNKCKSNGQLLTVVAENVLLAPHLNHAEQGLCLAHSLPISSAQIT